MSDNPTDELAATLDALLNPEQTDPDEPLALNGDGLEAAVRRKLGIPTNQQ